MKVLVTGAAGFVGSSLARHIVERGGEVVGLDLVDLEEAWRLHELGLTTSTRFVYLRAGLEDLRPEDIPPEGVVHCAASTDVGHSARSPHLAVAQSVHGTVAVLEAVRRGLGAVRHGDPPPRVVIVSSLSVYGAQEVQPIDETALPRPWTVYGSVKLAQEHVGYAYWRTHGVPVSVARIATQYGPQARASLPVSIFLRKALANEDITVTGDGSQSRDLGYIGDTVKGLVAVLEKGAAGEVYNIGTGRGVGIRELAEGCIAVTGSRSRIVHVPKRAAEEGDVVLACGKAAGHLGWSAETEFSAGLECTAKWFTKRHGG